MSFLFAISGRNLSRQPLLSVPPGLLAVSAALEKKKAGQTVHFTVLRKCLLDVAGCLIKSDPLMSNTNYPPKKASR